MLSDDNQQFDTLVQKDHRCLHLTQFCPLVSMRKPSRHVESGIPHLLLHVCGMEAGLSTIKKYYIILK